MASTCFKYFEIYPVAKASHIIINLVVTVTNKHTDIDLDIDFQNAFMVVCAEKT